MPSELPHLLYKNRTLTDEQLKVLKIAKIVTLLSHFQNMDFYYEKDEMLMSPRGQQIERKIDYCEDKIDAAVYELYGLTGDEIAIVEGGV